MTKARDKLNEVRRALTLSINMIDTLGRAEDPDDFGEGLFDAREDLCTVIEDAIEDDQLWAVAVFKTMDTIAYEMELHEAGITIEDAARLEKEREYCVADECCGTNDPDDCCGAKDEVQPTELEAIHAAIEQHATLINLLLANSTIEDDEDA